MDSLFPDLDRVSFVPNRASGLERLRAFQSSMGGAYASRRNHDFGPDNRANVSALSPWVRTRTLLESELVRTALDRYAYSTAEKFVQEVCWRTYFKGWLEHRPAVWDAYVEGVAGLHSRMRQDAALRLVYGDAISGHTGIDCFDAWARELVETGYLHNHARMWFASIWIYTLRLPWELGADFFLQHLMDGDAASNTCSWRWVCGLHTPGKTYLARADNIAKYTEGRFAPRGLAVQAPPVRGLVNPPASPLRPGDRMPEGPVALLLTEEDYGVETLAGPDTEIAAVAATHFAPARSPAGAGDAATRFADGACADARARAEAMFGTAAYRLPGDDRFVEAAANWAQASGASTVVTGFAPAGWVRPRLDALRTELAGRGIGLAFVQRDWDATLWPHSRAGFFGLKKKLPGLLAQLGLPV